MNSNLVCLARIPLYITKVKLKFLLKELCRLDIKLKDIDEYIVGNTKVVFIDYGDEVIPIVAHDRLKQLCKILVPNVAMNKVFFYLAFMNKKERISLPVHALKKYNIAPHNTIPLNVALAVVQWLHYELHLKYPQLHKIDSKLNHTVYEGLRSTLTQRVMDMMTLNGHSNNISNTVALYRKLHPFFADFELVLSHIASAEGCSGLPPTEYTEADLLVPTPPPLEEAKIKELWDKNSKVLNDKVQSYIAKLDTEESPDDSSEMVLRKKIRLTMKQFKDHLPQLLVYEMQTTQSIMRSLRECTNVEFTMTLFEKKKQYKMVNYESRKDLYDTTDWIMLYFLGEPALPGSLGIQVIRNYLKKHGIKYFDVKQCLTTTNAAKVYIPRHLYDKVMELNGLDPEFNLATTTDIIYIRHTNDPYKKEKYLAPTLQTLKQWDENMVKVKNTRRV